MPKAMHAAKLVLALAAALMIAACANKPADQAGLAGSAALPAFAQRRSTPSSQAVWWR